VKPSGSKKDLPFRTVLKPTCNHAGSLFRGSQFKPALVRHNVRFNMVLLYTTHKDSMKRTALTGLGQGL
jgi:hypothetical protein